MLRLRPFALLPLCLGVILPLAFGTPHAAAQGTSGQNTPGAAGGTQRGQGRNGMGRGVRGTVTATSGTAVTLKTEAGEAWTVVTTDNTRINIDRLPVKITDLHPGDEVMAMGIVDPDKHEVHAMFVGGASAATVAKLKADMGKTYIVGKVTAIDETRLTIARPDHVSQTIALDDSTSLKRGGRLPAELMAGGMLGMGGGGGGRRGNAPTGSGTPPANNETTGGVAPGAEGESITLADLKVGDNVVGSGLLKNGIFVPSELHVMVRREGRGPRRDSANGAEGGSSESGAPQQP